MQYKLRGPLADTNPTTKAMHAGVLRDLEQQRIKKERQLDFDLQKAMETEYRKVQNVNDGGVHDVGGSELAGAGAGGAKEKG